MSRESEHLAMLSFDLTEPSSARKILTTPLPALASASITRSSSAMLPLDRQTRFEIKVRLVAARLRAAYLSSPSPTHQAMWAQPESYWLRLSTSGPNSYSDINALFRTP